VIARVLREVMIQICIFSIMTPDLANNLALPDEKVQEDNRKLYLFHPELQ
jgi:hypothetical protein